MMVVVATMLALVLAPSAYAESFCVSHPSGETIDGWVSDGLAVAEIPDSPYWHSTMKATAWRESGFIPDIVGIGDANWALGHPSIGLEQIMWQAWVSTPTGKAYPFSPCVTDPVLSVAVRAELFSMGFWG